MLGFSTQNRRKDFKIQIKRIGNIYSKIYSIENLKLAHKMARKNKTFYTEVIKMDRNIDYYLFRLQDMLKNKTYKTSKYVIFKKNDKGKEREIYKLPYFPDRVCQWAIMLHLENIFLKTFIDTTCASIPRRGIHCALNIENKYLKDTNNTRYCLKMDVKKFFPNINHSILKKLLRRKVKDKNLLWLLDDIIDSIDGEKGLPIGNYTSQYFANYYLTYFDHWLKENKKVKYYIRYMDDMVIFHNSKEYLHTLRKDIEKYLSVNLNLTLKENWQVFPVDVRGVDFVGYRHFRRYILLRKTTAKNLKNKLRNIYKQCIGGKVLNYSKWCTVNSYRGWLTWCNSYNLHRKYIKRLNKYSQQYYKEVVLCDKEAA